MPGKCCIAGFHRTAYIFKRRINNVMFCNLGHDSAEGFLLSGADCRIQVRKMKTKEDMVQKQQRNLRCLFFHSYAAVSLIWDLRRQVSESAGLMK